MKDVMYLAAAFFLVVLTACVLKITVAVENTLSYVNTVPDIVQTSLTDTRRDLNNQLTGFREDIDWQLLGTRRDLNTQISGIRQSLDSNLNATVGKLDTRTGELVRMLDRRTGELTATVGLGTLAINAHLDVIQDTILKDEPMLFSRYLATTGELNRTLDATRRFAEAWAKAAPELSQQTLKIADNTNGIAANVREYTKPETIRKTIIMAPLRMIKFDFGRR